MEIMKIHTNNQARKWFLQKPQTYTTPFNKKGIIAMDLGECTFPVKEIDNALAKTDFSIARKYPHQASEIKKLLATKFGVSENMITLGNGSDEIIENIPRVFLNAGDTALIVVPTFFRFIESSQKAGVNIVFVKTNRKDTFQITENVVKKIIQKTKEKNVQLIWLCSPNNPTGVPINPKFIQEIASQTNALIVLDQIYAELQVNNCTVPKNLIKQFPNMIILKSFSKVFGLAGLRVGFAIASSSVSQLLQKWSIPFNTSVISLEVVKDILQTGNTIPEKMKQLVQKEREFLLEQLSRFKDIEVISNSQTNLILLRHTTKHLFPELLKRNIIVADFNNAKGIEGKRFIRINVGTRKQNKFFLKMLTEITSPSVDSERANLSEHLYRSYKGKAPKA